MSFQITKSGFYRQRNGGKAEVVGQNRFGLWAGFDYSEGESKDADCESWDSMGRYRHDMDEPETSGRDIVSEYHEPKFKVGDLVLVNSPSTALHQHYGTVEKVSDRHTVRFGNVGVAYFNTEELTPVTLPAPLPDGFRLKPRNVKPVRHVDVGILQDHSKWQPVQWWSERTAEEWDTEHGHAAPHFFAEPIPKPEPPFRISDHGCGVYETRDGRQVSVTHNDGHFEWPWCGVLPSGRNGCWPDSGGDGHDDDLVRYIGPLQRRNRSGS